MSFCRLHVFRAAVLRESHQHAVDARLVHQGRRGTSRGANRGRSMIPLTGLRSSVTRVTDREGTFTSSSQAMRIAKMMLQLHTSLWRTTTVVECFRRSLRLAHFRYEGGATMLTEGVKKPITFRKGIRGIRYRTYREVTSLLMLSRGDSLLTFTATIPSGVQRASASSQSVATPKCSAKSSRAHIIGQRARRGVNITSPTLCAAGPSCSKKS